MLFASAIVSTEAAELAYITRLPSSEYEAHHRFLSPVSIPPPTSGLNEPQWTNNYPELWAQQTEVTLGDGGGGGLWKLHIVKEQAYMVDRDTIHPIKL